MPTIPFPLRKISPSPLFHVPSKRKNVSSWCHNRQPHCTPIFHITLGTSHPLKVQAVCLHTIPAIAVCPDQFLLAKDIHKKWTAQTKILAALLLNRRFTKSREVWQNGQRIESHPLPPNFFGQDYKRRISSSTGEHNFQNIRPVCVYKSWNVKEVVCVGAPGLMLP